MRVYSGWLALVCLSFAACSDDDNGQKDEAVTSSDASTDESEKDSTDNMKSGSGGKAGTSKQATGAGGSKAASGDKGASPDANDDAKKDEDAKKDSKDSKESKDDDKKPAEGDKGNEGDKPGSDSPGGSESDKPENQGTNEPGTTTPSSGPATTGDQLAVCARSEGDCNQGLACHAPAGPFSAGRGYCSKICREDADCSGLAPEGTKYTCSSGRGTSTCEVACSGADDKSCPASMVCVQTGVRPRPAAPSDAGTPESAGDSRATFDPVYGCRHAFEVSKIWGQCGDASHVCGEGLRCAGTTWFGGAGHCTRGCESDADCEKPESGSAKPTCMTLVPAFGDNAAVKQCVLSCSEAKDGCPNGLACFEGPETRATPESEPMPAFAWCQ